jgi:GH15 family glucan-1,4-alpha-glucosidase
MIENDAGPRRHAASRRYQCMDRPPVRIGNAASTQRRLDIYGELAEAMATAAKGGLAPPPHGLKIRRLLLDHLEKISSEAARRIELLKQEIAPANSF